MTTDRTVDKDDSIASIPGGILLILSLFSYVFFIIVLWNILDFLHITDKLPVR